MNPSEAEHRHKVKEAERQVHCYPVLRAEIERLKRELADQDLELRAVESNHDLCAEHFRRLMACDKHIGDLEAENAKLREALELSFVTMKAVRSAIKEVVGLDSHRLDQAIVRAESNIVFCIATS